MKTIYIGYEPRESLAYDVCEYSIRKQNKGIEIKRLYSKDIPEYKRSKNEPQSTDFTFTRFLVPYLSEYKGSSIFCDCDFLFLADPMELKQYLTEDKAVWVVKHPRYVPNSNKKMDDIYQNTYARKNWSSLMVFNNSHPALKLLDPYYVNNVSRGIKLHQFEWLSNELIGDLPLEWNCLDGYYYLENPKAVHYTDGGPWFEDHKQTMYSELWKQYHANMTRMEKFDNEI